MFKRPIALATLICFISTMIVSPRVSNAQTAARLPVPGTMVNLSGRYAPVLIKGLVVHPDNPDQPTQVGMALRLDNTVARINSDWIRQNASAHRTHTSLDAQSASVVFDPEHLRRLMINLLDNALRYASQASASIVVSTHVTETGQARLSVWSDGPPLEKTVQNHLFEPFFSSESRSSGLGLYICRELCERYGAFIGYQRATRYALEGNDFFVVFRSAADTIAENPSSFDTSPV